MSTKVGLKFDLGCCSADELPELVRCWDQEFVFAKGRKISLAERFPELVEPRNLKHIYRARVGHDVCAAVVARPFRWITPERVWQGAMVGMVYTHPDHRGQGLASRVMKAMQDDLMLMGVDFGVLWTGIPSFYQKLGWISADTGLFGEAFPGTGQIHVNGVGAHPLLDGDIARIESIRARWLTQRVERSPLSYRTIPLPAYSVDVFFAGEGDAQGYALVGRAGQTGYVYELVGHPDTQRRLWNSIAGAYEKTYLNDRDGSPLTEWLGQQGLASFKKQSLAMWLPVSRESHEVPRGEWHIPFFDRI